MQKIPDGQAERADYYYFTDLQKIKCAKRTAKIRKTIAITK